MLTLTKLNVVKFTVYTFHLVSPASRTDILVSSSNIFSSSFILLCSHTRPTFKQRTSSVKRPPRVFSHILTVRFHPTLENFTQRAKCEMQDAGREIRNVKCGIWNVKYQERRTFSNSLRVPVKSRMKIHIAYRFEAAHSHCVRN